MRASKALKGGLQEVADDLGVMRISTGQHEQTGSDSLLTASIFFKMQEIYFDDHIDDAEYSGKLYGLGQTFSMSNRLTDPARGGVTIAEREDRGSVRDAHNQTPGPNNGSSQQTQPTSMTLGPMTAGIQPAMTPGGYGSMNNGPQAYMRTMVGGGR
ncbi:CCR4-NOT transcription complex subunit 8 [Psilocybe cubensis]|uniref:CCR4-NOT transcription complex subunit 8 n=2 Tax=Psilocybe cubensis TaxID=181762 RepID=A0ACB8HHJ2_PSICU|nr:CCR4-NOT transcription complex subunit 8 [Psilocybe cubensis]KAH9487299.1 CCR4-NOT transcription complex subunit 8 [Psilocybe cubensis]